RLQRSQRVRGVRRRARRRRRHRLFRRFRRLLGLRRRLGRLRGDRQGDVTGGGLVRGGVVGGAVVVGGGGGTGGGLVGVVELGGSRREVGVGGRGDRQGGVTGGGRVRGGVVGGAVVVGGAGVTGGGLVEVVELGTIRLDVGVRGRGNGVGPVAGPDFVGAGGSGCEVGTGRLLGGGRSGHQHGDDPSADGETEHHDQSTQDGGQQAVAARVGRKGREGRRPHRYHHLSCPRMSVVISGSSSAAESRRVPAA